MLCINCFHVTRSLQFKYHILTLLLYLQLPKLTNVPLHPSDSMWNS
jgi:hypothetical protein